MLPTKDGPRAGGSGRTEGRGGAGHPWSEALLGGDDRGGLGNGSGARGAEVEGLADFGAGHGARRLGGRLIGAKGVASNRVR